MTSTGHSSGGSPPVLSAYRHARAVVLGATGSIGRWVARGLTAHGANLHVVVRDAPSAAGVLERYDIRGTIYQLDVLQEDEVSTLLKSLQPSIVFNLIGYGVDRSERDEHSAYRTNGEFPGSLVRAMADAGRGGSWAGQQLIHVGTAAEYGSAKGDLREDTPAEPTSLYGRSKLAGTRKVAKACQSSDVSGVTARLFTVYGPGEHIGRLLPSLVAAATEEGPIPLSPGTQKRDFAYVEDIAEGLLRLGLVTGARKGEVVNLATGELTTVRRFSERGAEVLGIAAERLRFGALPLRADEMDHDPVCVRRLQALTGWVPKSDLSDGIGRARNFEGI